MALLQALIRDDRTEFERILPIMKAKTEKKFGMELDRLFYEALAERDRSRCEAILAELVSPKVHQKRNKQHLLPKEFISHPALGYAKLAWLKGVEVVVDSPLVPADLLPIRPNDNYVEAYDFLKRSD
jgi:hypothetical protein